MKATDSTAVTLGNCRTLVQGTAQQLAVFHESFACSAAADEDVNLRVEIGAEEDLCVTISKVIDLAYDHHKDAVYLDAATIVSPGGALLLAGQSGRGKTTTTLALCFQQSYQMVCEDISMIDFEKGEILSLVAPLSIREKTVELFAQCNLPALNLTGGRWFPCRQLYKRDNLAVSKVKWLFLLTSPGGQSQSLQTAAIDAATAIRSLLPISNLLNHEVGFERLYELLQQVKIIAVQGGTLQERVDFIAGCTKS